MITRRAVLLASLAAAACKREPELTVYLVRHAEKDLAVDSKDPPLSDVGLRHAQALQTALGGVVLDAIYATDLQRTQQTVAPAAEARSVVVETLPAANTAALVERIKERGHGAVLVAGHSNTLPAIVAGLGVKEPLVLGEADYGNLFVVHVRAAGATLERRRF